MIITIKDFDIVTVVRTLKTVIGHRNLLIAIMNKCFHFKCLFVYASKQDHDEEFLFQELEMHTKLHGGHIKTGKNKLYFKVSTYFLSICNSQPLPIKTRMHLC